MKKLLIFGIGETSRMAFEYFSKDSDYDIEGFLIDPTEDSPSDFLGLKVYDFKDCENVFDIGDFDIFVAISSVKLNRDRLKIFNMVKSKGYKMASYVSSKCFKWDDVEIGENCFILEGNVLQSQVSIKDNVFLWSGNHIGHGSVISENCFISSHVVVSGSCTVGKNCFIGVNSSIADGVTIGDDNFIAMSSSIFQNTDNGSIYKTPSSKKMTMTSNKYFKLD